MTKELEEMVVGLDRPEVRPAQRVVGRDQDVRPEADAIVDRDCGGTVLAIVKTAKSIIVKGRFTPNR